MINVLSVIGTRPEAIKMAPVLKELANNHQLFHSAVCVTGQHRELLDQGLGLFGIEPDYDLNLMQPDQTLSHLTAKLFSGLDLVVDEVKPNWVLAQGDTTTVLSASLVAFYHKIPFGHVEAGLRTNNKYKPFPEEINRRIADIIANVCFAPTDRSREALLKEGVHEKDIYVTGNTVIDALMDVTKKPYDWEKGPLSEISLNKRIVLITAHRRENFGEPLQNLCMAIRELALEFEDKAVEFVYPVHPNPKVQKPVYNILRGLSNVHLIKPLDYISQIHLMKNSTFVLTDSGGIQEEAPSLGIPVLITRDITERPEGVEAGVAKIVGTSRYRIVNECVTLLSDPETYEKMAKGINPYGDGHAAEKIVSVLRNRTRL
jgi:UDP-N-acetylglucosamine 2-epimerase